MPTKRQFDMVIIVALLIQPVKGLFKMAATRRAVNPNDTAISRIMGGAATIAS